MEAKFGIITFACLSSDRSEDTLALKALNDKLARDDRVHVVLMNIGDGLTLATKK